MEASLPTLGFLVHDVARLLRRRFEQNSRGSGLTRSHWQVLTYLSKNEDINQSGLAKLLDVEPMTLGRVIDKLVALDLIKRCRHPSDRRIWLLQLNPAALPKLSRARRLGDITLREALAGLPNAERGRLLKTLQVVKANLIEACDSPVARQRRVGLR